MTMKQVIEGRLYNTETAKMVGEVEARGYSSVTDFSFWHGTLYHTKSGRYFVAGSGGPATMFGRPSGNMTTGGSGIVALGGEEARSIAEDSQLSVEVLQAHFTIEEA
jgi:hypothetical protein